VNASMGSREGVGIGRGEVPEFSCIGMRKKLPASDAHDGD
jgi:hypothetical protein